MRLGSGEPTYVGLWLQQGGQILLEPIEDWEQSLGWIYCLKTTLWLYEGVKGEGKEWRRNYC